MCLPALQYLFIVLFFAVIYCLIGRDEDCNMAIITFLDGYMFSLETMVREEGRAWGLGVG